MKMCSTCNQNLSSENFYFHKDSISYRNECKKCFSKKKKSLYAKKRTQILQEKREYYILNKEAICEKAKDRYNLRKLDDSFMSKRREHNKKYYKKNKKAIRKRQRIYEKRRIANDPVYKLRRDVSRTIRNALSGKKAGKSILLYLPYTIKQLKEHLESQFEFWMTWENHGLADNCNKTWQIDHIIAQSKLPYDSLEHPNFQKCWALESLQPLESFTNIRKGNKE